MRRVAALQLEVEPRTERQRQALATRGLFPAFDRVNRFFLGPLNLDISTERLRALTPAVIALSKLVTGQ
jgi:hypothetical protein